ncbi:MAG: outer membrane beta-barrel protein [candidate division Zixibacteria bacterium]|nr:outer membrane beta-barrel protein [candidate division Zixibacteria bacterium]
MRRSVIVPVALAFLLCFIGIPSAEESGTSHKGDKGISFSVSGLSSVGIGLFEGGIGGKYWISKKLAIITSLGVSAQRTTQTSSHPDYTDTKTTYSRFSLFGGVEDHFFIKNKISPYLGGGIRFSTSPWTRYYSLPVDNPHPTATKKEKRSTKTFGIRGFCGIEYFFADWVSLAGQYQIDYFYEKTTMKRILVGGSGVTQPPKYKQTRTTLGLGTSSLVATFYIW